jgi:HTH-type transcriptional repressor of NAD biosynthesis genes
MKVGFVLGKFVLHKGHEFLINFAREFMADGKLIILVDKASDDSMSIEVRVSILRETFPGMDIRAISHDTPQDPSEHADFWNVWNQIIKKHIPEKIDYVIGSMEYIKRLASDLGCDYVMVDPARSTVPISATDIRSQPYKNWKYVSNKAKKLYAKKIVVVGAESTGKSTLSSRLASEFGTVSVPEYARTLIEAKKGVIEASDILTIAKGQMAMESILTETCNKLIFSDTELITTKVWSQVLFGSYPKELDALIARQHYDIYLLTDPNTQWEKDIVRYHPDQEQRNKFHDLLVSQLTSHKVNYSIVSGKDYAEKTRDAIRIVRSLYDTDLCLDLKG